MRNLCFCAIVSALVLTACTTSVNQTKSEESNDVAIQVAETDTVALDPKLLGARRHFAEQERKALAEEFTGVQTSEGLISGLYPIRATGISTAPIVDAATAFLSALDDPQKARATFAIDDVEWRKWLNVDNGIYARQGVSLKEMTPRQKSKAFALMSASLSAKGLSLSKNIMKTDQTLKELNSNVEYLDEELYFFTLMGTPSETTPWGWQIDGHHLVVNYFILGDQIVFAPVFLGAEPVVATSGKYEGNVLFQSEQDLGLALMQSLSPEQQTLARLGEKGREDMLSAGGADNLVLDHQGIRATDLTPEQQVQLLRLTEEYVGNLRDGHADVKMEEIRTHLADTWFAWRGGVSDDPVFYYRIHSPVALIEFDHQGPIGARPADGSRAPTRNHIHTMLRTPNGNDYGKDLLRQHLKDHH